MDESTRERLQLYVWKADTLSNKPFIKHLRKNGSIEHIFTISDDEGISSHHTGPDADAIEAAAAIYRLFTQKNDQLSFPAMAALLDNPDISDAWKAEFKRIRESVNNVLDETLPVVTDGKTFTYRYIVDIFLNGGIFHAEPGKVEIFQAWQADPLTYTEMEFEFIAAIASVSRAVFDVANLCRRELAAPRGVQ